MLSCSFLFYCHVQVDAFVLRQWFHIGESSKPASSSSSSSSTAATNSLPEDAKVVSLDLAWVASWMHDLGKSSDVDSMKQHMSALLSTALGNDFSMAEQRTEDEALLSRRRGRIDRVGIQGNEFGDSSSILRIELKASSFEAVTAVHTSLRAQFPNLEMACGVPPLSPSVSLPGSSAFSHFGFTTSDYDRQQQQNEGKLPSTTVKTPRGGANAATNPAAAPGATSDAAATAVSQRSPQLSSPSRSFALLDLFLTPALPGRRIQGHNCLPTPFARGAYCDRK